MFVFLYLLEKIDTKFPPSPETTVVSEVSLDEFLDLCDLTACLIFSLTKFDSSLNLFAG